MAGANYEWCPVCDSKALYVGEDDTPNVVVLHLECWRQVCVAAGFHDDRLCTGPGWSELLVAALPEPDYVGEASTPNWVTSDGTRITAHSNSLTINHDDRHDVELVGIDGLKMLAAVAACEQYRAQREATT